MGNNINGATSMMYYERAKSMAAQQGVSLDQAILSQSTLRLEQKMVSGKTLYTFGVLVNNNGPAGSLFPTEVRLNQQDVFITSELTYAIAAASSDTDAAIIPHTYPSALIFTSKAGNYELLYNSQLMITVNNRVITPTLFTSRFRVVPQSQAVAAATNQNGIAQDQIDFSTDGSMPTGPSFLLIGSKNNLIQLTLPAGLAAVGTSDRIILEFRGHLAQNSTIIT